MKNQLTLILLIILSSSLLAQYNFTSPYLQNPEKAIGFVDSCAQFWINTYDPVHDGFYTSIDKYGNVIYNNNKHMLTQTRNAYGMVRAYMLTADTTYLTYAREALNFMYDHAWDVTSSGWLQEMDEQGNALSPQSVKTCFYQHYALLGIAAYYECTRDTLAWNWLMKGYENLENHFWDERPLYEGYYDLIDYDMTNPRNKSFNATVDAITTHLLYLYLMTRESQYLDRLNALAEQIRIRLVASMSSQAIGFVEKFDSDWNWDDTETMTIMGHVLKAGWCLGRIQQVQPSSLNLVSAQILVNHVLQKGYDHQYGGPYKDYNRLTGEMLLWGLPDTTKAWWAMEQAMTAGLILYDLTADTSYLKMAAQSIDFNMKYMVDHEYGEVYADRTRYGDFAWNENKAGDWKAGYHSIEMGYYLYLYTSLFVHDKQVVLHYRFNKQPVSQDIILTPLAINPNEIQLDEVLHNGNIYTNFDPATQILHLPAGTSGHFQITFGPRTTPILTNSEDFTSGDYQLHQNYPNPFNPTTTITYKLRTDSDVRILVFDVTGQMINEIVNEHQTMGHHSVEFNASGLATGIYIYQLQAGSVIENRKMILMR
jgi:mannose/cellobiose epimerase-like protein (N-acyl-D-glucosamine 2-epimerase family)